METLVTATSILKSSIQHHHLQWRNTSLSPGCEICNQRLYPRKTLNLHTVVTSFAGKNSVKKSRRDGKLGKMKKEELLKNFTDESSSGGGFVSGVELTDDNVVMKSSLPSSSRRDVLQACIVTSGLMFAVGLLSRQGSHLVVKEGWPIYDCFTQASFDFETWHLGLIAGLVVLISSSRFLLLKTWPNFAESSEASNQMVLSQLEPLDYILVACLPGLSEELLFRGALMSLFGLNWKSALVVAAIFGVLHLGNGRKYSFAICRTRVGLCRNLENEM